MGETASARPPDTETCSNCGAEDWAWEEFGRIRRLSGWLQQGRPAPRARLTCRNCGVELSTRDGSWAVLRPYRTSGWWGAPLRVIRVLLLARLAIPAPWIYLAAVATGALLGLALDVTIGRPWWAVALGWVAGVWLLFLLTAFKGAGRSWELWLSLLDALDPKGASDRWNRRQEQVFRTAPFPLYGLPRTWRGPRSIGGGAWGGGGRYVTPTELELVHGDLEDAAGAVLRVTVSSEPEDQRVCGDYVLRRLAEDLWRGQNRPPPDLTAERLHEWARDRDREILNRETPPAHLFHVKVDGRAVPFDRVSEGTAWAAVGLVDDVAIMLRARGIPIEAVELVRLTDVEPYVEGTRLLRDR
ncbi:MAG TPA: hypothetical protein VGL16_14535 [Actinomycetota bacterium]|jgi:hypothetical protein